jgi:hypothetical protein
MNSSEIWVYSYMKRYKDLRGWYISKSVNILRRKRKNTNLLHFYQARRTLRNTKPLVHSLDTNWRTWHGGISVMSSLEHFHHQKLHLFEFGTNFKVLDFIFLQLRKRSGYGLATTLHFSAESGSFMFVTALIRLEVNITVSSYRLDTGVKTAR